MSVLNFFPTSRGDTNRPDRTSRLPVWSLILTSLILLAIAGVTAFCATFSHFSPYDDEGFLMISVQGFLHGDPLYDQVLTGYGPFYYFYEWLIHAVAELPLTHDITGAVCVFDWLLAASLLAVTGARITRSALTGFFVFIQAVLHLAPIAHEPGHPQELVVVLLAAAALIATASVERKSTLPLLGAVGAALVFTKINVGVFFVMALGLAMCSQALWFRSRPARFWGLLALSSLVPFVLMRSHLPQGWVCVYAAQESGAILAAGAIAYTFGGGPSFSLARAFHAVSASIILSVLFIVVLVLTGTSLSSIFENLVTAPSKLGSLLFSPLIVPHSTWWGATALLGAAAAVWSRSRSRFFSITIATAKVLYGSIGALVLLSDYNHYGEALGYLLPWTWLLLVADSSGDSSTNATGFARIFLCLQAVWQGLQAYPVPGTQAVIATFLPVLAYSLCLHDAFKTVADGRWMIRELGTWRPQVAALSEVFGLAGLLYLSIDWYKPLVGWRRYTSLPPLGLRGSAHVHLPREQVDTFTELSQFLETHSDAFITIPGFNSLYFWTTKNPPTYFNASEIVWMTHQQQAEIVAALQRATHPMIVIIDPPPIWVSRREVLYAHPEGPLPRVIRDHFREIKKIGTFRILSLEDASHW